MSTATTTNVKHASDRVQVSHKIEKLIRDLAAARAENGRLKGMLSRQNRYSSIAIRSIADAHTILMAAFSDESTSVAAMAAEGMTRRRWDWAVAFLRYAGIVALKNEDWRAGLTFLVVRLDEAISLLEKAATEVDGTVGYKRLRRLVKNTRRTL